MPVVTILEAYYGGGVVLEVSNDESRECALELALRTVEPMEAGRHPEYALRFESEGEGEWRVTFSRPEVQAFLKEHVTPEYRYDRVLLRIAQSPPYAFAVLSEDGSCVDVAPGWRADKTWYERFWATLWSTALAMEVSDPAFRLILRGGDRSCGSGHRMSPFDDACPVCGQPESPSGNGAA